MQQRRPASDFTFRGNLKESRYGWLRLTPAYSVRVVQELLDQRPDTDRPVLDPFCGTGTTLLACAERGVPCHTIDINPFLVWLAKTKARRYTPDDIAQATALVAHMAAATSQAENGSWQPALHNIHRWWSAPVLGALSQAHTKLVGTSPTDAAGALSRVAFCRSLIEVSEASFGHQSMSFKRGKEEPLKTRRPNARAVKSAAELVSRSLERNLAEVCRAATSPLKRARQKAVLGDSRAVPRALPRSQYGSIITSPPYCNRMSYIRELRPYMYWLGYLNESPEAGLLDWKSIGGTWGVATSNLNRWIPDAKRPIETRGFATMKRAIARSSPTLAAYVHRYFEDLAAHVEGATSVLAPGGEAHYVVGNSKFYDVMVPTEAILAALFRKYGLSKIRVETLRKRTSKKELYEYVVSGQKPTR
jgi:hypothetical protein